MRARPPTRCRRLPRASGSVTTGSIATAPKPDGAKGLTRVVVLGNPRWSAKPMKDAVRRAAIVVDAVCWARDLVNTPAGDMPPAEIAREAQRMARSVGLTCKVWNQSQLEKGGFGGIIGVGKGSVNPPRLIELTVHRRRERHADRVHGQGHRLRFRRPVDQGRQGHGVDEGRHGRGRGDPRDDEGDRAAEAQDQRGRRDPVQREHAERFGAEARRRDHPPRRHDLGGAEHRCGRPARARRRPRLPRRTQAPADRGRRDAHRARA